MLHTYILMKFKAQVMFERGGTLKRSFKFNPMRIILVYIPHTLACWTVATRRSFINSSPFTTMTAAERRAWWCTLGTRNWIRHTLNYTWSRCDSETIHAALRTWGADNVFEMDISLNPGAGSNIHKTFFMLIFDWLSNLRYAYSIKQCKVQKNYHCQNICIFDRNVRLNKFRCLPVCISTLKTSTWHSLQTKNVESKIPARCCTLS